MKKLLTVLLTLLMVFTLVGCNSKEDTPVVQEPEKQEEVVEQTKEEPEIVGGYIDVEDGTLTDELKDIFNKALEGLLGATYEPQELVATQVVAGTNYKFLANGTKTTNPITKGTYYITIYKDLQGNVELLDIETIEEKQEEAPKQDVTQMSFWVVFYDEYDNELQREALMYGLTPRYKGYLPDGFVKWTYKKTGKDVNTFVPITTNTYFKAVCNHVSTPSNPTPTEYTVTFDLYGATGEAPTALMIASGSKVTKPDDPAFANHTFAGWYKTKDTTTGLLYDPWDFNTDVVTDDMTLYAKWTKLMRDLLGNNFPSSTTNSAPDNPWTNENGIKAYIFSSNNYFKLDPGNANGLTCLTSNIFTRIGDGKYVYKYVNGSTSYGLYTLNIESGTLVSIEYNGAGTAYNAFSGTYAAPTTN